MIQLTCGHCRQPVFFENTQCGECGSTLGFVPSESVMEAFDTTAPDATDDGSANPPFWLRTGFGKNRLQPCANRVQHDICNWMLDDGDSGSLCISCRLTQVIPTLDNPVNLQHWAAIERAKRRLVFTLIGIGLKPVPKTGPDDKQGLAFHLLETLPGQPPVMTGHDDGLITLNIAEADDVEREKARVSMHEPVRTLLGHLRHEVSHYLQQRYIDDTEYAERCREVFGDERADYAAALEKHYAEGPPADWSTRFVSAYASSHPWEDWAETCAHYLLVIDAVQTAASWGLRLDGPSSARPASTETQDLPLEHLVLEQWLPVALFLNSMNRSLGLPDSYPFLLPPAVLEKMSTVQQLLAQAAAGTAAAAPQVGAADALQSPPQTGHVVASEAAPTV